MAVFFHPSVSQQETLPVATAKEVSKALLEAQPEDSSSEELVRELAFHVMVQRGLADSDAGRTISNEEMDHRIRSWQK
jgi:predicted transcriptional regulator